MSKSTKKNIISYLDNKNSFCKKRNNSKSNSIKLLQPKILTFRKWIFNIMTKLTTIKKWTDKLIKEQKITQIKSSNFKDRWILSKIKPKKSEETIKILSKISLKQSKKKNKQKKHSKPSNSKSCLFKLNIQQSDKSQRILTKFSNFKLTNLKIKYKN